MLSISSEPVTSVQSLDVELVHAAQLLLLRGQGGHAVGQGLQQIITAKDFRIHPSLQGLQRLLYDVLFHFVSCREEILPSLFFSL